MERSGAFDELGPARVLELRLELRPTVRFSVGRGRDHGRRRDLAVDRRLPDVLERLEVPGQCLLVFARLDLRPRRLGRGLLLRTAATLLLHKSCCMPELEAHPDQVGEHEDVSGPREVLDLADAHGVSGWTGRSYGLDAPCRTSCALRACRSLLAAPVSRVPARRSAASHCVLAACCRVARA